MLTRKLFGLFPQMKKICKQKYFRLLGKTNIDIIYLLVKTKPKMFFRLRKQHNISFCMGTTTTVFYVTTTKSKIFFYFGTPKMDIML